MTYQPEYVRPQASEGPRAFTVRRAAAHEFEVQAPWLERILAGSDMDVMRACSISSASLPIPACWKNALELGVEEDDTIRIGEYEFDYVF